MREQDQVRWQIRRLIWLYFWLLIFEGALRKWIVPSLSDPLLIVRDPVVIAIYFLALRGRIFPNNGFLRILYMIAVPSFLAGLMVMALSDRGSILVPLFGFRANFLHFPLIFIVPEVMDNTDLYRLGRWMLVLSIPMAVLMVAQFRADKSDWLNKTAGGEGAQLDSADGRIRPAGTFSFVTGIVSYLSLVTVFVIKGVIDSGIFSPLLLASAGVSLATSLAVSGSRSAVYSVGIVAAMLLVGVFVNGRLLFKASKLLIFVPIILFIATSFEFYEEGLKTTEHRFEFANASESLVGRFFGGFLEPFYAIPETPILGYGLGVGTNVGSALITGKSSFLLAEGEWARNILESGPMLGLAFILLRCGLAGTLGRLAVLQFRNGNILPLLLFGVCLLPIIYGQLGQPTILGFMIFSAGLCLTASGRQTQKSMVPV